MVTRETDGDIYVAVQHYTTNGSAEAVNERHYVWIPQHNVSLCWVLKEDVAQILNIKAKRCCGKCGDKYFLASEINTNLFETGER